MRPRADRASVTRSMSSWAAWSGMQRPQRNTGVRRGPLLHVLQPMSTGSVRCATQSSGTDGRPNLSRMVALDTFLWNSWPLVMPLPSSCRRRHAAQRGPSQLLQEAAGRPVAVSPAKAQTYVDAAKILQGDTGGLRCLVVKILANAVLLSGLAIDLPAT